MPGDCLQWHIAVNRKTENYMYLTLKTTWQKVMDRGSSEAFDICLLTKYPWFHLCSYLFISSFSVLHLSLKWIEVSVCILG